MDKSASSGTAYNDGVTNNDAGDGTTLIFDVQHDAPSRLYYQCNRHSSMGGTLVIDTDIPVMMRMVLK